MFLCLQYKIINGNPVWLLKLSFSKLKNVIYFKHTCLWFERRNIGKPKFQKHVLQNWFLIHPVFKPKFFQFWLDFQTICFYKVFKKPANFLVVPMEKDSSPFFQLNAFTLAFFLGASLFFQHNDFLVWPFFLRLFCLLTRQTEGVLCNSPRPNLGRCQDIWSTRSFCKIHISIMQICMKNHFVNEVCPVWPWCAFWIQKLGAQISIYS